MTDAVSTWVDMEQITRLAATFLLTVAPRRSPAGLAGEGCSDYRPVGSPRGQEGLSKDACGHEADPGVSGTLSDLDRCPERHGQR